MNVSSISYRIILLIGIICTYVSSLNEPLKILLIILFVSLLLKNIFKTKQA